MPRRVWVTGSTGDFDLVEVPAPNEHDLQEVMKQNPQLIPAEDLGLDGDLLVVGRETSLASGSVDLLCLARSGDLVVVEFKTGPQNPDFRHALAQVIDYGSDLWKLGSTAELDRGVVQRYLTGPQVADAFKECQDLHEAVGRTAWKLDDAGWEQLTARLDQVLTTGDFTFVVAAQRFTAAMQASLEYLNVTMRYGRFYLLQLVRLEGAGLTAYSAQVVTSPSKASRAGSAQASSANEADFLAAIADEEYRDAMADLLSSARSLGLVVEWGSKGASLRLPTPDRSEPLSVGWVFLDGGQWYGARHVTLGADDAALQYTPSVAAAVAEYRQRVAAVPGARPVSGKLHAYTFVPGDFPMAKGELLQIIEQLVAEVSGT